MNNEEFPRLTAKRFADLIRMPLEYKVERALWVIKTAFENSSRPVVAFSGGKDSTVILHLVRSLFPNTVALFSNTGVESRFTVEYIKTVPNLVEVRGEKTFWQCVDEYGWPGKKGYNGATHQNSCCIILKDRPADKYYKANNTDLVVVGLTGAESWQRRLHLGHHGEILHRKTPPNKCYPIAIWSENDVWEYIRGNNIPYNAAYDNGARRVGCMPCTAYRGWKKTLARENLPMLLRILKMQNQGLIDDYVSGECNPTDTPNDKDDHVGF